MSAPAAEGVGARDRVEPRLDVLKRHLLPPDTPCELRVCSTHQDVARLVERVSADGADSLGVAVLPIEGDSTRARIVSWARVVRRLRFTESAAQQAGLQIVARVGAFPSIDAPNILFELHGSAGRYAEAELLPEPVRGTTALVKRLLRRVGGLSSAIGGVIMVIGKP